MNGSTRRRRLAVIAVVVLLLASAAAYAGLLQVQQELFTNGLPVSEPHAYPRPGADLAAAAASLARYWPLVAVVTGPVAACAVVAVIALAVGLVRRRTAVPTAS